MTVSLRTALKCGRLGAGTVKLGLPASMRVPRTVPARAVLIGDEHASTVQVTRHTLAVGLPQPRGATCQSITFGVATIVLTKAAKLGNPAKAGRYLFVVVHHGLKLTTRLTIR